MTSLCLIAFLRFVARHSKHFACDFMASFNCVRSSAAFAILESIWDSEAGITVSNEESGRHLRELVFIALPLPPSFACAVWPKQMPAWLVCCG